MAASSSRFQFLLVQLRLPLISHPASSSRVSIPLGTIKACRLCRRRRRRPLVSIPLGTIKAGEHQCESDLRTYVSIPLGTIKAISKGALQRSQAWFQFLLVQLRRERSKATGVARSQFQFLLVQLRPATCTSHTALTAPVSIPLGTIKASSGSQGSYLYDSFNSSWYN